MRHSNLAFFVPHAGCPHRCSFCDQTRIAGSAAFLTPEEVHSTCTQALSQMGGRAEATEIAFFGGSFTAVDRAYRLALLTVASGFLGQGRFAGIRISTRPDAISREVLKELAAYGVTAIELGAQSMRGEVLAANGRGHTAAQVEEAARMINASGFSLGLQMMTGLYRDDDEGARYTAKRLAALAPDTMRIYPAVVLEGTELERLYGAGFYKPQNADGAAALCAELITFFEERGIRVIRVGLHASETLAGSAVAGAYHPAFRELCESRIFRRLIGDAIQENKLPPGAIRIRVAPGYISRAAGHRRANIRALEQEGYRAKISEDHTLSGRQVIIESI